MKIIILKEDLILKQGKKAPKRMGEVSGDNKVDDKQQNASQFSLLFEYSTLPAGELLQKMGTSPMGLSETEAEERLKKYGPNQLSKKKATLWPLQLVKTYNSPFNYLLSGLGIISFLSGNVASSILIAIMVCLSVLLKFFQESRSNKAAEKLQEMVTSQVNVLRQSNGLKENITEEIPIKNLVPGDIIHLSFGDLIPADIRLIDGKDLYINQSPLTGESFPIKKQIQPGEKKVDTFKELPNICFMGTSVVSGMATAVVLATGKTTVFGNVATKIIEDDVPTNFDKGVQELSWLLIRFILAMCLLILLINGFTKGDWLNSFLFALSVGVGLTPEMLPMIITTNLSRGALALSHKKVIVKRLSSIQNLGAIDILCTDKTGTLTQNNVILYQHLDVHGNKNFDVLEYAYLNSHFQSGLRNLLDDAILKYSDHDTSFKPELSYTKVDEIPFDFERRRLSVILAKAGEAHLLVCKGAVEEILTVCTTIQDKGKHYPITAKVTSYLNEETKRLNQDGFRVIAMATRHIDSNKSVYSVEDEQGLTLWGYIAFLDPPKETTTKAIHDLSELGIELKVLTGDNELITQKICMMVNLSVKGILLGKAVDALTDLELAEKVEQTTIFAKLTPNNKQRIVQALQQNHHVVGFLGDGINDAPALRAADVGLSVDNAVDIAKESADMILLEQSLLVLKDGVLEGRQVFGNIIKYIRMSISSNFGNVFSMLGASFLLPFLPMKPIQILTQNLLYDFSQTAIPFDSVDSEFLAQPHRWEIPKMQKFMVYFGPISSLFDYALFAVMWYVFQANNPHQQRLFQTGWFVEGLLTQTLIVHLIRTRKVPFFQSWAAPQMIFMTVLVMVLGIYFPYAPFSEYFGFIRLPLSYFIWLSGILLGYCLLTQRVKEWFIKKYGYD